MDICNYLPAIYFVNPSDIQLSHKVFDRGRLLDDNSFTEESIVSTQIQINDETKSLLKAVP
jgi:hypothetical protein